MDIAPYGEEMDWGVFMREVLVEKIGELFPDCEVYAEGVPQGFAPPCFFVELKENRTRQRAFGHLWRQDWFDIQYFSASARKNDDGVAVAERLYDAFVSSGAYAVERESVRYFLKDGVLHFLAAFSYAGERDDAGVCMGEMRLEAQVRPDGDGLNN